MCTHEGVAGFCAVGDLGEDSLEGVGVQRVSVGVEEVDGDFVNRSVVDVAIREDRTHWGEKGPAI